MHIRAARPDDSETLGNIAWSAKASWGYSLAQLEEWRDSFTPTGESILTQPTFVTEIDNKIAGFCQIVITASPVELEHLWVHPDFMRRGAGRALLDHAVTYLANLGVASLSIDADPNAEPFYIACRAVRIGAIHAPIAGEPDRIRPQLRLSIKSCGNCSDATR
jgi:ribosomal protein S18 acetylase RimI-like enzyme